MRRIVVLVALAASALPAMAQPCTGTGGGANISVTFSPSNGGSCSITYDAGSGKYNVTLNRVANVTSTVTANVRGTSSDNLHTIDVNTNNSQYQTWVSVGTLSNNFQTIDRIVGNGTGTVVLLDVFTTGHLGVNLSPTASIEVDSMNSGRVGGDLLSPILIRNGDLLDTIIDGSLYANVTATNGSINALTVIGAISTGISTTQIRAKNGIKLLKASSITADVDTKYNSGSGDLWYLETTSGNFSGSLNTRYIQSPNSPAGIDVAGTISAPITITEYLDEPLIASSISSTASIAKGLRNTSGQAGSITLGSSGLVGQVIVNAGNATSNAWTGNVTVGGTALSTIPYYSNLSANLGGGSVGQAIYHLHDEDCQPANGYVGGLPGGDDTIRLRWYGPLVWTTGDPVTVEYRNNSSQPWTDITDSFTFSINSENTRELVITPGTLDDWSYVDYRITPTSNLKCGGVTGTPAVYGSDSYIVGFYF